MDYSSAVYTRAITGTDDNPGLPVTLANLVVAQSEHESGNYASDVFLNTGGNAFGYKYSGSKYQHGDYNGYAKYLSIDDSTAEVVDYIYRRVADGSFPADLTTITTPDQYATLLQNAKPGPYYGDTEANYSAGLASWFTTNVVQPLQQNPSLGVLILVGIAAIGYFISKRKK
jgi:uncharacterized FlgJ-related protein